MRRLFCGMMVVMLAGCAAAESEAPAAAPDPSSFAPALNVDLAAMQRLEDGLYIRDVREGGGRTVSRGDDVAVRYAGWLPDGTLVDSNVAPAAPREFRLGERQVIRGWEQGVMGMRVGGQRQIIIPPALGYGGRQVGNIPPNATLVFLVELVSAR
ncbi:MAG TPA: FKBP-type peptidyl-prolyl cis-trans isomerase [Longimicrobium sp.]|nr:FKBP-type peptidyl-prolyl cis-trans isomerase [Longimicrobium sp.]